MRVSDVNKFRKLRHAQAVLLGITIKNEQTRILRRGLWSFTLPLHLAPPHGYQSGMWKRRWECVECALKLIGVGVNLILPDAAKTESARRASPHMD